MEESQTQPPALQSSVTPEPKIQSQKKKIISVLSLFIILLLGAGAFFLFQKPVAKQQPSQQKESSNTQAMGKPRLHKLIGSPTAPIRLNYAIHWTEQFQTDGIYENGKLKSKGLKQYLEEYVKLHPEIAFQIQVIQVGEYAKTLQLLNDAGTPPDIYQIYSAWAPSYVKNNVLDTPPASVVTDVKTQYVSNVGATIDGKIWGFPTEVNTYTLVYNKDLFQKAGISKPPTTFNELVDVAKKTTKYDQKGNITQYGIAFLKGNDWQVVDPFLAWLFTNNGQYLSSNLSQALFNSPEGQEVLDGELRLFKEKATDNNSNFFDFSKGKVAMVIAPPWPKALFKEGFKDKFETTVGVAPLPYFKKPTTLQYSWFMGVTAKSQYKKAAWEFLQWFNTQVQPTTNTTRYGDLLANTIGAIPSRRIDLTNHQAVLTDFFTKVFIEQIQNSVAEPNVLNADSIKKTLMGQIEAAWSGQTTSTNALQTAADEINKI